MTRYETELLSACQSALFTVTTSCRPAGNPDVDDESEIREMLEQLRAVIAKAPGETIGW